MRDRLIELIDAFFEKVDVEEWYSEELDEALADHLLAEGVIVPPAKIGQTCFQPYFYRKDIDECRVSSITQKADGSFKIRLTNLQEKWVFEITPDEIGKTIFLTREEAEKALERSEDGT